MERSGMRVPLHAQFKTCPLFCFTIIAVLPDGIQDLTVDLDWLGVDKDESDHTGLSAGIDPIVDRAALHEHVARLQRSEEHTSELQSQSNLVCRLLLEKKKKKS